MDQRSKEFKTLQKRWYDKLKKSGFDDIEQDEDNLKKWDSHVIRTYYTDLTYEAKEIYYRKAEHFLSSYEFKAKKDRLIWEMHSEGVSIREITLKLKKRNFKTHKNEVNDIIRQLANIMLSREVKHNE